MNLFSFLSSPIALALGHSILYSLWQAFIVFIGLRIILKMIPNASSKIKYSISYIAYMSIAGWFLITLFNQLSSVTRMVAIQQTFDSSTFQAVTFDPAISASSLFSFSFLNNYLPFIAGSYLIGMLLFAVRLTYNYFQSHKLKTTGLTTLNGDWQHKIAELAQKLNIEKKVSAYFSKHIDVPMMLGFFKPVILLPLATMNHLSVQQFEAILLHELAHIRRNDYLFNLLQSIVDTILFFNPFIWWITKNIREEREKSCDEMVLQVSDPYHYARALLALEEPFGNPSLVMTAVGKRSQLLHRIKNIMEMKNNRINLRQKLVALLVIATATFSVAWLSPKDAESHVRTQHLNKSFLMADPATAPFINCILSLRASSDSNPTLTAPLAPSQPNPAAPPTVSPLPAIPPVANVPMPALPPIPPLPKMTDTFPPLTNYFKSEEWKKLHEEIAKSTADMQKYFQSDAWKKQQAAFMKSSLAMSKYFNSAEWKKQQQEIQKTTAPIQEYFNSPEWKKQQHEIQKNTKHFQEYFNSPEWKKQQKLIQKSADSVAAYFKSDAWKKQQENMQKVFAQTQKYFESSEWKKQQEQLKALLQKQGDEFKKEGEEMKKILQKQKEMQKEESKK